MTRERVGVDRDLLSRNFPLSSDSSIHLPEPCPEPWAGFALAPSPCEPPGAVSSEAQPGASQLGLETRPGGQPAPQSQPGPASPPGEAGRPRGPGQLPQRPLAAQGHRSPRQPSGAPPHVPGEPRPPDTNLPDANRSIQECQDESLERGRGRVGVKLLLALCSPPAAPSPGSDFTLGWGLKGTFEGQLLQQTAGGGLGVLSSPQASHCKARSPAPTWACCLSQSRPGLNSARAAVSQP